jgi:AbrB family looped-hinge helix DNA binding protein
MKVSIISYPNEKGQIVIPSDMRKALGITSDSSLQITVRGGGIYIQPVKDVIHDIDTESSYAQILQKVQGSWTGDSDPIVTKRKDLELEASKRRKQAW